MDADDHERAAAAARTPVEARRRGHGFESLEEVAALPGVELEDLLTVHRVIARGEALGSQLGVFPIDLREFFRKALEQWITTNCSRTAGQTAWECVDGRLTLVDTDTYLCPDGSRHTVRTIRERTKQRCP